ncbi:OsmC family protein [Scardovia inopinata]|uniref:OsmC-like protein n=1 Tax=Scardovia inopinata F0304 TaxID=641146 RepID=W5IJ15_SCAIO|nr:hypothetical protein HMPREF9020_00499 [Scardovia inopinata F0304]BAR06476.1 conserved hypothetical protein [Scardovia inopinata JCM 12537]SUV51992.1 OsmC family protein [Scardovia inopinata]
MARLWVERKEDGTWVGHKDDKAEVVFGHGDDVFSPGDLLKIALAACAGLSSQFAVESALGQGKGARIVVDGTYDSDGDKYVSFSENLVVDATDAKLSDDDAAKLEERIKRHIDKSCTVKHTLVEATPVRMDINIRH